jgi:hypothetical protein
MRQLEDLIQRVAILFSIILKPRPLIPYELCINIRLYWSLFPVLVLLLLDNEREDGGYVADISFPASATPCLPQFRVCQTNVSVRQDEGKSA